MDNIQPSPITPGSNPPPRPTPPPPIPPRPVTPQPPVAPPPKPPITPPQPPKPLGGIQVSPVRPMAEPQPKVPPPPPAPTAQARSLQSDISSLKASGGASPRPQVIKLEEIQEGAPTFKPGTVDQTPLGAAVKAPSLGVKKIMKVIGSIVIVVALGLLGYYVVYPLLFPAQEVLVPVSGEPASKPSLKTHQSLFLTVPESQAAVNLTSLSAPEIFGAIQQEALEILPAGSVKELSISGADGQAVFADYISGLLEIGPESLRAISSDDFSGFVFYDAKGIWPGYVAALKSGVSASDAMSVLAQIEQVDVRRFYANDPGINDIWKDGPYKGYPARYSSFSALGASFNYGVVGNYIVLSTSFDGFKKAVEYLGY